MFNVPNALSAFRLVGSVVLIGLSLAGVRDGFAWLLAALLLSDWIDGKLAIAWKQQTTFGARLDSLADTTMYGALLFGLVWLYGDLVRREWPWLAAVVVSFAVTTIAGLIKYRRVPSYHTRGAKTSWLLVCIAALSIFAGGPVWPLRLAAVVAVLTNVEATVMTFILRKWHADVPSVWHAIQIQRAESPE
jgi:phosphatidylglycerophosphate synthase